MNGTFNGQILVDKLSKLNNSQQSIETLSHWCIFHRKNAKQVVETWGRQFHSAPKTQWVSFLYLANDILQNSRRKGLEFVNEFWKVLPDALNNAVESGDEFGRSAALRLIDIWEDRKVFGSRGQALKDEIFGRKISSLGTKNLKTPTDNSKSQNDVGGGELQKLISSYQRVYEGPVDEHIVFNRCQLAIGSIDKVEEIVGNPMLGDFNGSHILEELEGQHMILRECVEELKMAEASRASLVSNLRGALQEQESKLERVRQRLQASQLRLEQVGSICQRLTAASNSQLPKETTIFSDPPPSFIQEADFLSVRGGSVDSGESRKVAAAAMAAKLTTSAASAEMLSYVLSSLAAEGKDEASNDGKRPRLETNPPSPYVPQEPPLPPPSLPPPPLPPMPPPSQYVQVSSSSGAPPYGYGAVPLQRPKGVQGFSMPSNVPPPPPHFLGQTGTYQRFTQQPPLPAAPPPPPPPPQSASRQ